MRAALRASWRFWAATPLRSLVLLLSLAAVAGIAASLWPVASQTLMFRAPEIGAEGSLFTLGMRSPEGRFVKTSLTELATLDDSPFGDRITVYGTWQVTEILEGREVTRTAAFVSENFFHLLGVRTDAGLPLAGDEIGVAITSAFSRARFGQSSSVLGRTLALGDGELWPVRQVLAEPFTGFGGDVPDMILPLAVSYRFQGNIRGIEARSDEQQMQLQQSMHAHSRRFNAIAVLGREEDGVALADAWQPDTPHTVELQGIEGERTFLQTGAQGLTPAIVAGADLDPDRTLAIHRYTLLFISTLAVLCFIVLVNLGSHLLARLPARLAEMRVRAALGARHGDLARELLDEQVPFVIVCLTIAVPLSIWLLSSVQSTPPFAEYFAQRPLGIDIKSIALAGGALCLIVGIAVSIPIFQIRKLALGQRGLSLNPAARAGQWLISLCQWIVTFSVLALAVLATLNAERSRSIAWGGSGDPTIGIFSADAIAWRDHVESGVGFATHAPLAPLGRKIAFTLPELEVPGFSAYTNMVSDNYFSVLGVPLLAGEPLSLEAPGRVVVSASLARMLDAEPETLIGRTLNESPGPMPFARRWVIGGVVGDIRYDRLHGDAEAVVYSAAQAVPNAIVFAAVGRDAAALRALAPDVKRLSTRLAHRTLLERRLTFGIFSLAIVAVALTGVGLVAEAWFMLAARSRELTLRLCLGASTWQLVRELFADRLPLFAIGLFISLAVAHWAIQTLAHRLPLVGPQDLWVVAGVSTISLVVMTLTLAVAMTQLRRLDLGILLRIER